jgi:hypothetical protein
LAFVARLESHGLHRNQFVFTATTLFAEFNDSSHHITPHVSSSNAKATGIKA